MDKTFECVVQNGQVRLPLDANVPDQTKVFVVVPESSDAPIARIYSPRLAHPEQAGDFEKCVVDDTNNADL